jgi:hypothetical protein
MGHKLILPINIFLADDMKNVPLRKIQPSVFTWNVRIICGLEIEKTPNTDFAFPLEMKLNKPVL